MINKFEEKLYNLGQKIGLTFDEREAMRARLLSKIAYSERDTLSPYSPMFYWRNISLYVKPQYVSMALLAVLLIGGISTAAEKALPGQPLYQVKTSVNENVLGLFAFTPQSKAQLHTELAVRRLEEVETMAMAGTLDATTTAQAESKIDSNLAVIKDSVKQLETDNNSAAAVDTSSKAESSLKVHEAILDTLVDGNATVNNAVQDLATKVSIQATALSLDRAGIDSRNSSTTLSIEVLLSQQKAAQDAISAVQVSLASATSSTATTTDEKLGGVELPYITPLISSSTEATSTIIGTTTINVATSTYINKAEIKLQQASDLLSQGNAKLDVKDYGDSFVLLKQAEDTAREAGKILEAGEKTVIMPVDSDVSTSIATSTGTSSSSTTSTVE